MTEQELIKKITQILNDNLVFHSIREGIAVFVLKKSVPKIANQIFALSKKEMNG